MVQTKLPTMAGNVSTAFPANLTIFSKPLHLLTENLLSLHLSQRHLQWQVQLLKWSLKEQSVLKIWLCPVHEIRYELFLRKMYFYQEPVQEFS